MEKKIEALPSLSLEEFQEKKKQQRTKKKKILQKFNSTVSRKQQNNSSSSGQTNGQTRRAHTTNEGSEESERALLVGSQKRKARKQTITRNAAATNSFTHSEDQEPNKCKLQIILFAILILSNVCVDANFVTFARCVENTTEVIPREMKTNRVYKIYSSLVIFEIRGHYTVKN